MSDWRQRRCPLFFYPEMTWQEAGEFVRELALFWLVGFLILASIAALFFIVRLGQRLGRC